MANQTTNTIYITKHYFIYIIYSVHKVINSSKDSKDSRNFAIVGIYDSEFTLTIQ